MSEVSLPGGGEATEQSTVDGLRAVFDLMENFKDNDQRARYLLSSNWMQERLPAAGPSPFPACPPWCASSPEQHEWHIDHQWGPVVDHVGPRFSEEVATGASTNIAGAVVDPAVEVEVDQFFREPASLATLIGALGEAAQWLATVKEAQR